MLEKDKIRKIIEKCLTFEKFSNKMLVEIRRIFELKGGKYVWVREQSIGETGKGVIKIGETNTTGICIIKIKGESKMNILEIGMLVEAGLSVIAFVISLVNLKKGKSTVAEVKTNAEKVEEKLSAYKEKLCKKYNVEDTKEENKTLIL